MRIYLLRHGKAPSASEAKVAHDADRPLSEQGRIEVRAMARHLSEQGSAPEVILASPLKRAQQTAAEAAQVLKPKRGVQTFEPLANQVAGEILYGHLLREAGKAAEVLAVGHQPQLGEMASYLTGQILELKPGGVIALDAPGDGRVSLLWTKNP